MFKIALNAGHYFYEPGRRISQAFDAAQTREWVLNARICQKVEERLSAYEGYSLLRVDDPTGEHLIPLAERAQKVNAYGADVYVSVHHNGGIDGGTGGGIMAYTYLKVDDATRRLQTLLYNKVIEHTGLTGNRATPLATADFAECRLTAMPAVLLECGFMDSATDAPIILTEAFADGVAQGITEALVEWGGLTKKAETPPAKALYRVQVGAYAIKENAQAMADRLKNDGYDALVVKI